VRACACVFVCACVVCVGVCARSRACAGGLLKLMN